MDRLRKPFQGTFNIVRFNWHFYVLSLGIVALLFILRNNLSGKFRTSIDILVVFIILSALISLLVSCYIYDFSGLYKMQWLNTLHNSNNQKIVNIHAGFDETSYLLKSKYSDGELIVLDFYDPLKHTEVSIKRARKAYPAFPNTQQVSTSKLPIEGNSIDKIFAILSAHEIRNEEERISFFNELYRILKPNGEIIVTEHLRDRANFLAYNIGCFHFYSKTTWLNTFSMSNLKVKNEIKITSFISTFILSKNGTTS